MLSRQATVAAPPSFRECWRGSRCRLHHPQFIGPLNRLEQLTREATLQKLDVWHHAMSADDPVEVSHTRQISNLIVKGNHLFVLDIDVLSHACDVLREGDKKAEVRGLGELRKLRR